MKQGTNDWKFHGNWTVDHGEPVVGHKKATVGHNESAVGREEKNERGSEPTPVLFYGKGMTGGSKPKQMLVELLINCSELRWSEVVDSLMKEKDRRNIEVEVLFDGILY